MKALLDSCVWGGARAAFAAGGIDAVWAGEWAEDPGDSAILLRAFNEGRVLVTLDRDFGTLAVAKGEPHRGIIRLVDFPARQQGAVAIQLLKKYESELASGAIITARGDKIRVRLPSS